MNKEELFNFYNIAYNLLNSEDDRFERFFEKLYNYNKDVLYLYILFNRNNISRTQILYAKKYYELRNHIYNWHIKSIIVCNSRKVSKFLGFKINSSENILNNEKCFEFILNNIYYFNDLSIKNFIDFSKNTGLNLTSVYNLKVIGEKEFYNVLNKSNDELEELILKNAKKNMYQISFNALGSSIDRFARYELYNHDLLIENEADEIIIKDEHIVIDGKDVYTLNNEQCISTKENEGLLYGIRYEMCRCELICDIKDVTHEQVKLLKEKFKDKYQFFENVKQIYLSPFQELFVLYKDGKLYKDNKIYASGVLGIWDANDYTCYLVFENNTVEYICTHNICDIDKIYDKVIYNGYFIAFLKDKHLSIISKGIYEEINTNYHTFLDGIDDICISKNNIDIDLIKNGNKITFSVGQVVEKYE